MGEPAGLFELENLFTRILQISVGLGFMALTVMLVYAGIKFITSGGDPKQISAAWNVITWAFLGILFMGIAWLIILLVQEFTGVNMVDFNLGFPQ